MDVAGLAFKLLIGFALGAVIGLEREVNEKRLQNVAIKPTALIGLRSFSLITALGVITGFLYQFMPGLAILIGAVLFLLLLLFYTLDSWQSKDVGITTELGMIFSFVVGVLLSIEIVPIQLVVALTVVLVLLLSQKQKIKDVVEDIKVHEINAFVSFAILALVILPFLPNTSYALADIPGIIPFLKNFGLDEVTLLGIDLINPFKLWLIVVLIIGVDLIGYILERLIGTKKGWLLASAAGGFVSSTATTQSLAQESKHNHHVNPLLAAAILSNLVSFVQIAFLIGLINGIFLAVLSPIIFSMLVVGTVILFYFLVLDRKIKKIVDQKEVHKKDNEKIIDIGSAVKFALLFLAISVISKITLELFGTSGFFVTTGIGALIGLDAVMINTATLATGTISYQTAALAFIVANAVNLFGKAFYSYLMGKREFANKFLISMVIIVLSSFFGLLFV